MELDHAAADEISLQANGHITPVNLETHELLIALQAVRTGDFSVRLRSDQTGIAGKIADTFNDIVAANERMANQLERVGQVVGREGRTRQRVDFGLASGAWGEIAAMERVERGSAKDFVVHGFPTRQIYPNEKKGDFKFLPGTIVLLY